MFGHKGESLFASVLEKKLEGIPAGVLKGRIIELRAFLSQFLIKDDQFVSIEILGGTVALSAADAAVSYRSADIETLLHLRSLVSSKNFFPAPKLQDMQHLQAIMERRIAESLSQDRVVRGAQELFCCENISEYLNNLGHDVKKELVALLRFFSEAARYSGDWEFSSSLEVIVTSLLKPT